MFILYYLLGIKIIKNGVLHNYVKLIYVNYYDFLEIYNLFLLKSYVILKYLNYI